MEGESSNRERTREIQCTFSEGATTTNVSDHVKCFRTTFVRDVIVFGANELFVRVCTVVLPLRESCVWSVRKSFGILSKFYQKPLKISMKSHLFLDIRTQYKQMNLFENRHSSSGISSGIRNCVFSKVTSGQWFVRNLAQKWAKMYTVFLVKIVRKVHRYKTCYVSYKIVRNT